jgi:hypothetical protein
MLFTNLRVNQTPGRQGAVIVERDDGNSVLKIEVLPWTIDETTAKTNLSVQQRIDFVVTNLDAIQKIAAEKYRRGQIENRNDHGRPLVWISIEPQDLLHLKPKP